MAPSQQTLSVDDRRLVAAWAADCAEAVLDIFTAVSPADPRVSEAIEQARAFACGDLDVAHAIQRRGGEAGAAARDTPTPGATAAAYAAEQAAAVAHMGAHALGAAGHAAKARALASPEAAPEAVRMEVARQLAAMDDDVAAALSALPSLGTDRSGPLGPGRLSSGYVGEAIDMIQAGLRAR